MFKYETKHINLKPKSDCNNKVNNQNITLPLRNVVYHYVEIMISVLEIFFQNHICNIQNWKWDCSVSYS